ncbi:ABC transporter permease [Luteococcus sp. Sow4_B9]|uniref:ABC transporter permease n=1 Tax=Luteococcus sp. Sow4_B9 TaxID=3438792 RepID=UPI003F95026E
MNSLQGTGLLLRVAMRRNWLFWLLWILALASLMPATASQYEVVLPPGSDARATLEPLANNPSMLALLGPVFNIYTKGGFVFWRVGGFCSMLAGMLGGFAVIRATRAEEEDGRHEMLRAGAVGRHAPLVAAQLLCCGGSVLLATVTAGLAIASGLPPTGAMAAGLALGGQSLLFTGIGAVAAQVFDTARAARGWTVGVVWGGMLLARMVIDGAGTDAQYGWLRWLIPMEWGMLSRPWADERWWVLALPVALALLAMAASVGLESRRDHGAGLWQSRPGPATGSPLLTGSWGLAWRLHRASVLGWALGLLVTSLGMGSIMSQMDRALAANPQMGEMLEKMGGTANQQTAFYVAMIGIMATIVSLMSASLVGRLPQEETRGHAEQLLATATSRVSLALGHLVTAVVWPSAVFLLVGALMPLAQARSSGHWELLGTHVRTAAGLLPGVLLVTGFSMLLIGWLPRFTWLVWLLIGWSVFTTWFAVLFDLPRWLLDLQPWGQLPHLPRDAMDWSAWLTTLALAAALMALGLWGWRRRDIPA